jgi:hypothetical protein
MQNTTTTKNDASRKNVKHAAAVGSEIHVIIAALFKRKKKR